MPLSNDQIRERLREYAAEFAELARLGAPRRDLLNGIDGKHGLNHLNEVFAMLPEDVNAAEFKVRE